MSGRGGELWTRRHQRSQAVLRTTLESATASPSSPSAKRRSHCSAFRDTRTKSNWSLNRQCQRNSQWHYAHRLLARGVRLILCGRAPFVFSRKLASLPSGDPAELRSAGFSVTLQPCVARVRRARQIVSVRVCFGSALPARCRQGSL